MRETFRAGRSWDSKALRSSGSLLQAVSRARPAVGTLPGQQGRWPRPVPAASQASRRCLLGVISPGAPGSRQLWSHFRAEAAEAQEGRAGHWCSHSRGGRAACTVRGGRVGAFPGQARRSGAGGGSGCLCSAPSQWRTACASSTTSPTAWTPRCPRATASWSTPPATPTPTSPPPAASATRATA